MTMAKDGSKNTRVGYIAPAVVLGLAITTALFVVVLFSATDSLPREIGTALRSVRPPQDTGMNLIEDGGALPGWAEGARIALLAILVCGIPVGFLGIALAAKAHRDRREWPEARARLVYTALVFQLCSLVLAVMVFALFLGFVRFFPGPVSTTEILIVVFFAISIAGDVIGLQAWRYLERSTFDRVSIAAR
jgi:hypothetical protein